MPDEPIANEHDHASSRSPRDVGELLCARSEITPQQLADARQHLQTHDPRGRIGAALLHLGFITHDALTAASAALVDTPFTVLHPGLVQPDALASLPRDFLEQHNILPLTRAERWLTIAMEKFSDVPLIEDIARRSGCRVQVVAATGENIRRTRDAVLGSAERPSNAPDADRAVDGLDTILDQMDVDDLTVVQHEQRDAEVDLEAAASDSPVVKLVNYIIQHAVRLRASDIHIEPDEETFRTRYRIDGDLIETVRPNAHLLPAVVSRIKIMAGMDISERRLPQDGAMTVLFGTHPIDLRVSTMTARYGEKVVMRLIDRDAAIADLDSLGMPFDTLTRFRVAIREANGIVLVTGPTGSGKTTTLYAAMAEIMSIRRNISTIEDPVERRLIGANQFQVDVAAGFTFARALRSMLRQDPDVIMVGEIRDTETARLATEAALTGHMVFSTLHTNDSVTAIPRLINMGVEPYLVAATLRCVLAQRLVRRNCPACRTIAPLEEPLRAAIARVCGGESPIDKTVKGKGCTRCSQRGVSGRTGVFELLTLTEEMLIAITQNPDVRRLRSLMREERVQTLFESGLEVVARGDISAATLMQIVSHVDELLDKAHEPDESGRTAA